MDEKLEPSSEKQAPESKGANDKSQAAQSVHTGSPVCLININEEGTSFELDDDVLDQVMERAKKINEKKCMILSVVGAFRTGKSFLLDIFLRYLTWCEQNNTQRSEEAPSLESRPKWLEDGGFFLHEGNIRNEEAKKKGFNWRSGKERTTSGIWMWDTPFVRTTASGEKVPVILMDTQGMFDFQTGKDLTAAIFGLSTLISSYQIYNLSKQIQEDKLQQLHYFTEFSRVALVEFQRAQERHREQTGEEASEEDLQEEKHMHPFQCIDFLVRDWQNFDDEEDLKDCIESMPGVLENALVVSMNDEGTRDEIKKAFENIQCFLLPHPGTRMTKKKYDGDIRVIEPLFLALLDTYVHRVFSDRLTTKKLYGKELGPIQLGAYIKAYAEVFKTGHLPKALTLVQAIAATTNLCGKDDALRRYILEMDAKTVNKGYLSVDTLKEYHRMAAKVALEQYNRVATFGEEQSIREMRQKLIDDIQSKFEDFVQANEFAMRNGLQKFVIWLLVAIAAYILDTFTDWTCDSWSQTCQSFSRLMALYYYCFSVWLGHEFWKIYNAQGGAAVGMGASALFHASLKKFEELKAKAMGQEQKSAPPSIQHLTADQARASLQPEPEAPRVPVPPKRRRATAPAITPLRRRRRSQRAD